MNELIKVIMCDIFYNVLDCVVEKDFFCFFVYNNFKINKKKKLILIVIFLF